MIEPPVWIAIGTLLATVIGLTISSLKIWFNNRANQQGIKILSDLLELNREVERFMHNSTHPNLYFAKTSFTQETLYPIEFSSVCTKPQESLRKEEKL